MKKKIKKFRGYVLPIIVGIILMSIVTSWVYNENRVYRRQTLLIIKNEGDVIVETIKGIIQSQMRRHKINKGMLQFLLNRVVDKTTLKTIVLFMHGKNVFTIGQISSKKVFSKRDKSFYFKDNIFYYNRYLDFERLPPPPPNLKENRCFRIIWDENKFKKEFKKFYNFKDSKARIIIGFDISTFKKQMNLQKSRLLAIYFISLIAIIIFIVTWIFIIKNTKMRIELEKAKDRTEKLKELGLAAAGLAHEVKNPLGIIRGFAQEISKKPDENLVTQELADKIIDEADITTERLSDFMNYAKHRPPKMENVEIERYLKELVELLQPEFDDRQIKINLKLEDVLIEADKEFLNKIIINILLNSIQACSAGDEVSIEIEKESNNIAIKISDNGPGISENLLKNIFKPYVSGYSKGHGIGLAIVKKLIEESGWEISMVSTFGEGTETEISKIRIVRES